MNIKTVQSGDTVTFTAPSSMTFGGYTSANTPWLVSTQPPFDPVAADRARRDLLGIDDPQPAKERTVPPFTSTSRVGLASTRPANHHHARDESLLLSTDSQQTIDGWVGQVLVLGAVVWQSPPVPATGEGDYDPDAAAVGAARDHLVGVLRGLFAAPPATSNPTGFTATSGA